MQMKFLLAKEESGRKQPKQTALESPETSLPELGAKWNQTSLYLSQIAQNFVTLLSPSFPVV